jgi:hypothetical protein
MARLGPLVVAAWLVAGCASAPPPSASQSPWEHGASAAPERVPHGHGPHGHGRHRPAGLGAAPGSIDERLAEVARIHGGAGPWAVAGYRMGEHALKELGLERGSFDLIVTHFTPKEVQFACIADGAAAATGASTGKLNLELMEVPVGAMRTSFRNRSTGREIRLRVTPAFAARFADVPRDHLAEAGRLAMEAPDPDVFQVVD